jgi:NADPH2:quinone reductase
MKALRVHGFDGFHQWSIDEVPTPQPGSGQVRVKVEAVAPSFVDLLFARGRYQLKAEFPFIPGSEFCGVVDACGADAPERLAIGTRVAGTAFGGAWAQHVCAAPQGLLPIDAEAPAGEAAALVGPYATAHHALVGRGGLRPGEVVFVLGAGGSVGMAALQVAKALGAQVVAGASGAAKCAAVRAAGADAILDLLQGDLRERLRSVGPGGGIDVVVDTLGGDFTDVAFRSLRWGGRHLVIGFAGGPIPSLRTNLALLKGAALIGVDCRQFMEREPAAAEANLASVGALYAQGLLKPLVHAVHPFERWQDGLLAVEARSTIGRVVLRWS